jgi:molecular chaperone GrpE
MTDEQDEYVPEMQNGAGAEGGQDIAALLLENADLKDRLLRALAEAENVRRRAERERKDASQYAVTAFARDMLTIADNFQRALNSLAPEARGDLPPQAQAVLEGIEATERQLLAMLERHGVKKIDTSDGRFDPNLHQAIAEVAPEGKPAGSIVNEVQTGYVIADRLLRPAMVTVARNEPGSVVDTKA